MSVVLSFRNEEQNIRELVSRLEAMFAGERVEYEIVFVNDASTDSSLDILRQEHQRNPRVKVVTLSRRFGVAEGVLAGMSVAAGDAVVYMDADLQDPPEIIPSLLERWRAGADVVHTVRTRRHGEHPLKMWATSAGYRVIRFGSAIDVPLDAGDFKLLSRRVVRQLLKMGESDPYLRGLVAWIGFTQAFVTYERQARHRGRTHFPFFSRGPWKAFLSGFSSFSFLPVYLIGVLALAGLVVSGTLVLAGALLWLTGGAWGGGVLLAGVVGLLWATLMAAIAAVGLYVIRTFKDTRRRPPFIVESTIGIAPAAPRRRIERRSIAPLQR